MNNDSENTLVSWVAGPEAEDSLLSECANLFTEHYGIYSPASTVRPGQNVQFSSGMLRNLVARDYCGLLTAHVSGFLVAYAAITRVPLCTNSDEFISWVSQLVTHRDYRRKRISSRLLASAWGFSDDFAWGLVTSSPYAIRALESATRRRCDPDRIAANFLNLQMSASGTIPYVTNASMSKTRCTVDTKFFVDHSMVNEKIARVSSPEKPWVFGLLAEGEEWPGFTFREQIPSPRTEPQVTQLLGDADQVLRQAYSRMRPGESQAWANYAYSEALFVKSKLSLVDGCSVLDVGCGRGRHAIELTKLGLKVTAVDFVSELIKEAEIAAATDAVKVDFLEADARTMALDSEFDAVLCLYDVIGSFPDDTENDLIIANVARHARTGGYIAVSVMNYTLTENIARLKGVFANNPNILDKVPPSRIMQNTGAVFNPDHFFLDTEARIVYRKEQFSGDGLPPWEVVIRDRRYTSDEISNLFAAAGVSLLEVRHVQAGRWDTPLDPTDGKAKEILFIGLKQ